MRKIIMQKIILTTIYIFILTCFLGCKKNNDNGITPAPTPTPNIVPAVYSKIYGATSITSDGTYITIKTSDQPGHKSAYWATNNPLHEPFTPSATRPSFTGGAFMRAPNNITAQTITIKIPLNPAVAATHAATPMGVMGVAIDGVPFFNQYAAGGVSLGGEVNGFDQAWGHPQASGMYHYHVEPYYLTTVKAGSTKWGLMGFLLDGFPVYGPKEENNTDPTGLDVYHGHTHNTADFPTGIYHYHISFTAPYINGNGFYGTPGTVTQ
jgi:hypothetical protein